MQEAALKERKLMFLQYSEIIRARTSTYLFLQEIANFQKHEKQDEEVVQPSLECDER